MLHRDIYWLGSQWAVTGYGIQLVSDKFGMDFDVEITRIWDEDLDAPMRSESWFDAGDFSEAVTRARRRAQEKPDTFRAPLSDER